MNRALFSKTFLLPVLAGSVGVFSLTALVLILTSEKSVSVQVWSEVAAFSSLYSFMGCLLHEKIARCHSSLLERAVRFGTFYFTVSALPLLAFALPNLGVRILLYYAAGLVCTTLAFILPIHLLYHHNPKGDSPYFSVSEKFQVKPS